jgi:hypothetical protein
MLTNFTKDNKKYYYCDETEEVYDNKYKKVPHDQKERLLLYFNQLKVVEEQKDSNPILIKKYLLTKTKQKIPIKEAEQVSKKLKKRREESDEDYLARVCLNESYVFELIELSIIFKKQNESHLTSFLVKKNLNFKKVDKTSLLIELPVILVDQGFLLRLEKIANK